MRHAPDGNGNALCDPLDPAMRARVTHGREPVDCPACLRRAARPECERLAAVAPFSNHVGDFLDWLREQGYVLGRYACPHGSPAAECPESKACRRGDNDDRLWPAHVHPERLLAEFYGIDLAKVEAERSALLAELQAAQ